MSRVFTFPNIIICYRTKGKIFLICFLVLYHNDTWMIPRLIDSICNLVIIGDEIIIINVISRYFQVWNNIDKKFVKTLLQPDRLKFFFLELFPLDLPWRQLLLDKCYFRFCFCFTRKKGLTIFQNILLSVMSLVLISEISNCRFCLFRIKITKENKVVIFWGIIVQFFAYFFKMVWNKVFISIVRAD